ncbi:relaxase/mobilization nuclease domain-containing protein [Tolypothrix sp. PCC 7910]|uniref:relaxase/mobilization nuclease domain-containing protein n=1 Tax=Tolypothrix sp. PCC 7910 TaxID=2099387 RepID=UPI0014277914|nr:relaxase/mobilization nuclease domain-containing protein [Tolypothrix sp. PCC 7910]QIR37262.1 relaxase/mobilization nuclease domain-containing protein [Tolypothrix sp. PCC 7910]
MIGKIKKGKSFTGLTKYILEKEQAELLCTNLAGETPQDFYQQLSATRQLNPRVRSPVSHISIGFPPTERPDKQQLKDIVEGTLAGLGFEKNLYFAASHNDCNHFHLHIAASRINIDGECVSDWYDKRRLEKVLRNLESQFDLTPVPFSWNVDRTAPSTGQKRRMRQQTREFELRLRDKPADPSAMEKIQNAVDTTIRPGITMTQFLDNLKSAGIETQIKVNSEGVILGISYSIDGVAFPGRKLGRNGQACTLKSLLARGINCDFQQDALALESRMKSNNPSHNKTVTPVLIGTIQNHPQNLFLLTANSHSSVEDPVPQSQLTNLNSQDDKEQTNYIVTSKIELTKHNKLTEMEWD